MDERLAKAKRYLAIAESKDSKREAYKAAANEIAAAKKADRKLTNVAVATSLGKSDKYVGDLLRWKTSGFKATTPFLADEGATTRAAVSHAKAALRDPKLREQVLDGLTSADKAKVATTALRAAGVSKEIAADPADSATLRRVSGQVTEDVVYQTRQKAKRNRTEGDTISTLGFLVEVVGEVQKAQRVLAGAYEAARGMSVNPEQMEAAIECLDDLHRVEEWFRSYLLSGDQSFEDELAQLLENSD